MNRLLLKECLDELRSDDSVELTEAHNNRQKKKNGPRRPNTQIATSGPSKPTSRKQPHRKPTTLIDSKAGQELASLAATIAREGAKSPEDFLNELSTAVGRPMTVADNSKYFSNFNTGTSLWLRIANHRATARWFFENGHPVNNFGIVIKLVNKRFVPDKRVQYQEEVFFKEDLNADMEIGIVKGLMDWISTGRYTGPVGNETCFSPSGKVVRHSRTPQPQSIPQPQPPQPPAPPPDEPGVKESLAKYFQGTHDMKYRLLKEAALRELMEEDSALNEDWAGSSGRDRLGGDWKNMRYPEEIEQVIKNEVSNYPYSSFCDPPDAKGTRQKRFSDELEHNRWVATASNYELLRAIINPDDVSGEVSRRIDNFGGNPAQYTAKHELIKRALSGDETAKKMVEYMKKALDKQGRLSRLDALTLTH